MAMSDDRSTITIPEYSHAAILDAVQRAVMDRGASKATRKAAFSALLALIEAGLIIGNTSINSPVSDTSVPAPAPAKTRLRLTG
jgi:hypothetical protein